MKFRALTLAAAFAGSFLVVAAARGQAGETFTATASVKWKGKTHTAPVRISIQEMSSEAERTELMAALKKGTHAGKEVLQKMKDRGEIDAGEWKAPIRYAFARSTGSGRVLSLVTAQPLLHIGAGLPDSKPKTGYDVAVAILVLEADGSGHGEIAPAAKVHMNASGAIVVDDYASAKVWLKGIKKAS